MTEYKIKRKNNPDDVRYPFYNIYECHPTWGELSIGLAYNETLAVRIVEGLKLLDKKENSYD